MMDAASRSSSPEDEQSPSAASSEASGDVGLEAANDYYRQIVAARSTQSQAEGVQLDCAQKLPALNDEDSVDLREVELGESAMTQVDAPTRNQSSPTISTTVSSIHDNGTSDDFAHVDAAPKWSKSQKKRLRQGKKRRAMAAAKLSLQGQPAVTGLDMRDGGQSSLMTSTIDPGTRDTEATVGVLVKSDQAERHPSAQASRQYLDHSIPVKSDLHAAEYGKGLSEAMTLTSSGPLPEAVRTNESGFVENDLSESDPKLCAKASQSNRGLPSLPVEIQLQILEACVVTSRTYIVLIADQTFREFCEYNSIALTILRTCRLYRDEGSKMFRERNDFAFHSVQGDRAFSSSLEDYSRALPNLKHLTLVYTTRGCPAWFVKAHQDFSRTARLMPKLEALNIELESSWNSVCSVECEHCPIKQTPHWVEFCQLKALQYRLRRITLSGRSLKNEMRTVTLSGEPNGDHAPILNYWLVPALYNFRYGK